MTLAELIASGRATCKLEDIVRTKADQEPVLDISRCVAYEQAAAGELAFVVRIGRRYLVSVPALMKFLQVPLPEEWQLAGAGVERCHCGESEPASVDRIISGPKVDAA
jgi:hypothetical protein